jgi:hypothetical protein
MSTETSAIKVEEVIFYIDLLTDFIKKKHLIKGLKSFIEEKTKFNIPSFYGIVMFQGKQNPVNVYNKKDFDSIESVLDDSWDTRETGKSFFENGVFEILSYIFGQAKTGKNRNYRIIILSDTPSLRSEDYSTAVYDLIVKSKSFSTSIDVIRVGRELNYPDEVKLKVITSETKGGAFYCSDYKHFLDVLGSLVKNRQELNIVTGEGEGVQILDEDKTFYEKLAVDLISLDSGEEEVCSACLNEVCPICEAYSDEIQKCFNCGTKFHSCCAAKYAISNNVGFRHIYKCPQCQTLLKLDEDLVDDVYRDEFGGEVDDRLDEEFFEEESEKISKYSYENYEDEIEPKKIVEPVSVVDEQPIEDHTDEKLETILEDVVPAEKVIEAPAAPPPPGPPKDMTRTVKVGGFFGREVEVREGTDKGKEPLQKTRTIPEVPKQISEVSDEKLSITTLRPPRKRGKIKFCKICGSSVSGATTCPNCGAKMD